MPALNISIMIYDKIDNIELYKGLSEDIFIGLEYLKNANPEIEKGVHDLNSRVKAIVSEYETKLKNEYGFEAHRQYIDIQGLLVGEERVACMSIEKLKVTKPYSEDNDAAFYAAEGQPQEMIIGNGHFAIFYPHDGHMPQLCVDVPKKVKKVVVKIKIEE